MSTSTDNDEYYNEEEGDFYSYFHDGDEYFDLDYPAEYVYPPEQFYDCIDGDSTFPPPLKDYEDITMSTHPEITFSLGQSEAWHQIKKEVSYFLKRIKDINEDSDDLIQNLFDKAFGEDSTLFAKCKKIGIKSFEEYSIFMATFFLECRFSITYQKLYDDLQVDTSDFLEPERYKAIWRSIDMYKKSDDYSPRAWEEFEEAFNEVAKELFIPTNKEFKMRITMDDDKQWFNFHIKSKDVPIDENSRLAHGRHVKDNVPGLTADISSFTGSGVPIHLHYRRKGESEHSSVLETLKYIFRFGEGELPNLSGRAEFTADRGFLQLGVVKYVLSLGCDILGTIKRQKWFPFTFGVKPPTNAPSSSDPEFIDVAGAPCVFQKRVKHNLGKRSNKDHNLTATAFRNGHSSSVAMLLSSDCEDESAIDLVIDTAKNDKNYFSKKSKKERFMMGFDFLVGEKDRDTHPNALLTTVAPLTQTQGDKTWWIMRSFSCVSSVMDRVIRAKAPNIDNSHRRRDDYEIVAMYANFTKLLPGYAEDDGEDSAMSVDSANSDQSKNSDHTISDETVFGLQQEYQFDCDSPDEDGTRPECDWHCYVLRGQ